MPPVSDHPPGSYGVLARWRSGGGVAAVERNFASARRLAERSLLRFQGGDLLAPSLPREPGALLDVYGNAATVRISPRGADVEVVLVRFQEDVDLEVPLDQPTALALRVDGRLRAPVLYPTRRAAWEAAQSIAQELPAGFDFDIYAVEDRRPAGGLLLPDAPRVVSFSQAADRWLRNVGEVDEVNFEQQLDKVAAVLS